MRLDKPGAGIPDIERLSIKNILIPTVRIFFTWKIALFLLKREVRIIKSLVNKLPREKCIEKNIIDRTFAIEDDTRQFSINMVLEHLTIAGTALMAVIKTLSEEKEFNREITIEGVKPFQNKLDQINDFIKFYDSYVYFIENLPKKQSKMTKAHPWFVEFNNFDWSIFMFMHTFIHRRQIEAIIKELK
jgi:hypothetical protein